MALNFYRILAVDSYADFEEVKAAYEDLSALLMPDSLAIYSLMSEVEISRRRSELEEAYRTLGDPQRRAAYDRASGEQSIVKNDLSTALRSQDPDTEDSHQSDSVVEKEQQQSAILESNARESKKELTQKYVEKKVLASKKRSGTGSTDSGPRRLFPTLELVDPADAEYTGSLLRRFRESAGATIADIAEITKINKHYIVAIENEIYDDLPTLVYVRGFILEYARVLGLNPTWVAGSYLEKYRRHKKEGL